MRSTILKLFRGASAVPAVAATTEELCERALRGDRGAWNALISRFHLRLWQFVLYRFRIDDARADDLCQDTWLTLTRRLDAGVIVHLILPGLAKKQAWFLMFKGPDIEFVPLEDIDVESNEPSAESRLSDKMRLDRLTELIHSQLTPRQRAVLLTKLQFGCTDHEVSERLGGMGVHRVRELKSEAYARLRPCWAELEVQRG
jgi:DNA-directed RNA polymerase specialized sigma24 family protein